jgi:hypothetical protein
MPYTPPDGDNVDFIFEGGYTVPDGDNVNFLFGVVATITVNSISRNTLYDDDWQLGFEKSYVKWQSDAAGDYRIEVGGNGVGTGSLIKSGKTFAGFEVKSEITDDELESMSTFSGTGTYRFNIYVKSEDNIWNPYTE